MVSGSMKICFDSDKCVSWIFAGNTIKGFYARRMFVGR